MQSTCKVQGPDSRHRKRPTRIKVAHTQDDHTYRAGTADFGIIAAKEQRVFLGLSKTPCHACEEVMIRQLPGTADCGMGHSEGASVCPWAQARLIAGACDPVLL